MTGQITILGAGPTGLGTAYRLAEMGHDQWDIYERADHVGGLASSYTDEHGFIWDHGGHVMFSHYTYFDELVEKMLAGDFDEHLREAWVWMRDDREARGRLRSRPVECQFDLTCCADDQSLLDARRH